MSSIKNPALPLGSTVLVTGINGFIGSHIVNELLLAGYKVRGTVRNTEKNAWVQALYDGLHGKGNFELVEVKDLNERGAFDEVLKGVSGVIHSASNVSFKPDPNEVIPGNIDEALNILKATAAIPTIKRFVYTSSSTAVVSPDPGTKKTVNVDDWNEAAVKAAWAPPPYDPSRGYEVYSASKTETEQAVWKFMKEEKPGFILNTVLPDTTFGKSMDAKNQGHPSTSGFVAAVFNGTKETLEWAVGFLPPQYFVNVEDVARLHVIGLINSDVKNERIFATAAPFNFNDILAIFRKNFPQKTFVEDWPGLQEDLMTFTGRSRADALLKEFGRPGFTGLEETILKNVDDSGASA